MYKVEIQEAVGNRDLLKAHLSLENGRPEDILEIIHHKEELNIIYGDQVATLDQLVKNLSDLTVDEFLGADSEVSLVVTQLIHSYHKKVLSLFVNSTQQGSDELFKFEDEVLSTLNYFEEIGLEELELEVLFNLIKLILELPTLNFIHDKFTKRFAATFPDLEVNSLFDLLERKVQEKEGRGDSSKSKHDLFEYKLRMYQSGKFFRSLGLFDESAVKDNILAYVVEFANEGKNITIGRQDHSPIQSFISLHYFLQTTSVDFLRLGQLKMKSSDYLKYYFTGLARIIDQPQINKGMISIHLRYLAPLFARQGAGKMAFKLEILADNYDHSFDSAIAKYKKAIHLDLRDSSSEFGGNIFLLENVILSSYINKLEWHNQVSLEINPVLEEVWQLFGKNKDDNASKIAVCSIALYGEGDINLLNSDPGKWQGLNKETQALMLIRAFFKSCMTFELEEAKQFHKNWFRRVSSKLGTGLENMYAIFDNQYAAKLDVDLQLLIEKFLFLLNNSFVELRKSESLTAIISNLMMLLRKQRGALENHKLIFQLLLFHERNFDRFPLTKVEINEINDQIYDKTLKYHQNIKDFNFWHHSDRQMMEEKENICKRMLDRLSSKHDG